ncbi:unnamed protein product [Closterium sp. NIES-53]
MATPTVLTSDDEGRAIEYESSLKDLHSYLLSCTKDDVSLFEHTSVSLAAPPETIDPNPSATETLRQQFRTDRIAFKHYSSPSSATLGRLVLPFLFPELSDFATVTDLMTHLRSLNTRYHVALKPDFMAENQPPMYFTLYFFTTRLPSSLHTVRDHFFSLDPTELTRASFESSLFHAKTSACAVAASHLLGVEEAGAAPSWRRRGKEVGAMGVVEVAVAVAVAGVVEVAVVGGPEVAVVVEVPGVAGVVEEAVGGRGGARGGGGQGVASGGATGGGGGFGGGQQQQPRREESLLP